MTNSRRVFLRTGSLAALGAGLLHGPLQTAFGQSLRKNNPAEDFHIPYPATIDSAYHFTPGTFQPYVGGIFGGRGVARAVSLTLLSVDVYDHGAQSVTRRARRTSCFSLQFQASGELTELTTIHRLEHAALGEFELFLTRHDDARGQIFYEAIINHSHR